MDKVDDSELLPHELVLVSDMNPLARRPVQIKSYELEKGLKGKGYAFYLSAISHKFENEMTYFPSTAPDVPISDKDQSVSLLPRRLN